MIIPEIILFSLILIKGLHFTYHFQVKEYRWDRLHSAIKEIGWLRFLYNVRLRPPAKTSRNILIMISVVVGSLAVLKWVHSKTFFLFLLIVPFLSFGLTSLGVYLTSFLANVKRKEIIQAAKLKVTASKAIGIGITGTYGKSSVKEFLYHVLSEEFNVAKTDKNMNTDVGIALSVLKNIKPETDYFITEYGAYKVGEIEDACKIIKPAISVLTGLGNQHLDLYGSKKNLVKAETYILNILEKNQKVYINHDFPDSQKAVKDVNAHKTFYSLEENDIYTLEIHSMGKKQSAKISYKGETFPVETSLLGRHNILNLLPAIAVAYDLGMKKEKIIQAVNSIQPIEGKLSLHKGIENSTIINDSYNSVVNGFLALIDVITDQPGEKKIIASKGIIELGVEKRSSYQLILDKLAKTDIMLLTTDPLFGQLQNGERVVTLNDEDILFTEIKKQAGKTTIIGIEGKFTKRFIDKILAL